MLEFMHSVILTFINNLLSRIRLNAPFKFKQIREIKIEKLMNKVDASDLELIEYYIQELRKYEKEIEIKKIRAKTSEEVQLWIENELKSYKEYINSMVKLSNRDSEVLFYECLYKDLESRNIVSSRLLQIFSFALLALLVLVLCKTIIHITFYLFSNMTTWLLSIDKFNEWLDSIKEFANNQTINDANYGYDKDDIAISMVVGAISPLMVIPSIIYFIASIIKDFIRMDLLIGLIVHIGLISDRISNKRWMYINEKENQKREFINQQLMLLSKRLTQNNST